MRKPAMSAPRFAMFLRFFSGTAASEQKLGTASAATSARYAGRFLPQETSHSSSSVARGGLVFGGTTSYVSPPLAAFRHYCTRPLPETKKHRSVTVGDLLRFAGVSAITVYSILIRTDYSGERGQRLAEIIRQREERLKGLKELRRRREAIKDSEERRKRF